MGNLKYIRALEEMPPPGGNGFHMSLMRPANIGVLQGLPPEQIFRDIRAHIKPGTRQIKDSEISDAIDKALKSAASGAMSRYSRPAETRLAHALKYSEEQARKLQKAMIRIGGGSYDPFEYRFSGLSPVPLPKIEGGMISLIKTLYQPSDLLYIGPEIVKSHLQLAYIRCAAEWEKIFLAGLEQKEVGAEMDGVMKFPFIIPNPLTGYTAPTQDGSGESYRGNNNVLEFRYVVLESDSLPLHQQIPLLRACRLKVCALIYSGGKSLHAWVKAPEVRNLDEWREKVKCKMFDLLGKIGFDPATSNPARLSRLPGIYRPEKGRWQELLYLNPEGGILP